MPITTSRRAALALAAAALAGCSSSVDPIPAGALVSCSSARDCPSGWVCHNDRCSPAGSVDATPPELVGEPALDHGRVAAGQPFTVSFTVSEALAVTPSITFGLAEGDAAMACSGAGPAYTCSYTPTGGENGGAGGELTLALSMIDVARNPRTVGSLARVVLDFAAPRPLIAGVAYTPGAGNPLPSVTAATGGTEVRVVISADEALGAVPVPALVARRAGADPLPFTHLGSDPLHPNEATFRAVVPAAQPDGTYALEVTWADDLGNDGAGPAAVPGAEVRVKTSTPVLAVDQAALVFVRSPQGNGAPEPLGGYTIPAGPYFALEPAADPLSGAATLPEGALLLADGTLPSAIVAQSSADSATALVVGTLFPDGAGRFPRRALVSPDLVTLYLAGVDVAGNRSAPVKVEQAEWVASTGAGAAGASPHVLSTMPVAPATRALPGAATPAPGVEVAGADGTALAAATWLPWRQLTASAARPSTRNGHAVAYDVARGRLVLFGGRVGTTTTFLQDVWEWDGTTWWDVTPAVPGPSARYGATLAYDAAQGRLILQGGVELRPSVGPNPICDTWELRAGAWTRLGTCSPATISLSAFDSVNRRVLLKHGANLRAVEGATITTVATDAPAGCAMAFDPVRQRTIVQGTAGSTWEWNGSTWAEFPATATSPSCDAAEYHSAATMSYDAVRRRLVFAHQGRTWERSGTAWTERTGFATTEDVAGAYDLAGERTVLVGTSLTLAWDGTRWRDLTPTGLAPPSDGVMAYDVDRARAVLLANARVWEWNGAAWREVTPAVAGPTSGRIAYDPVAHRTLVVGGARAWSFNGTAWTDLGAVGSGTNTALAYDEARSRGVLLDNGHTYTLNGATWTDVTPATIPPAQQPSLAYDAARSRTVYAGGPISTAYFQTWEWSGAAWTRVTGADDPLSRGGIGLAFDRARGRTLLFGGWSGFGGERALDDLVEFDGATWTTVTPPAPRPAAREAAAVAFDTLRERLVLFGGYSSVIGSPHDTWELDCAPSRAPALQLDVSAAGAGITDDRITGLRVRAFAGGTSRSGVADVPGAQLLAWSSHAALLGPGWSPLAENDAGLAAAQPYLPDRAAALLPWASASAAEARRLFLAGDRSLAFQVRPAGTAGASATAARVALDYLEVRVRYAAP